MYQNLSYVNLHTLSDWTLVLYKTCHLVFIRVGSIKSITSIHCQRPLQKHVNNHIDNVNGVTLVLPVSACPLSDLFFPLMSAIIITAIIIYYFAPITCYFMQEITLFISNFADWHDFESHTPREKNIPILCNNDQKGGKIMTIFPSLTFWNYYSNREIIQLWHCISWLIIIVFPSNYWKTVL